MFFPSAASHKLQFKVKDWKHVGAAAIEKRNFNCTKRFYAISNQFRGLAFSSVFNIYSERWENAIFNMVMSIEHVRSCKLCYKSSYIFGLRQICANLFFLNYETISLCFHSMNCEPTRAGQRLLNLCWLPEI